MDERSSTTHNRVAKAGRQGTRWERRTVDIVLPIEIVRAMCNRAGRWSVDEGGRFDPRPAAVLLWSRSGRRPSSRLLGSFRIRWRAPAPGLATIDELRWNPSVGGSLEEVCRAMEVLAGRT
jgi:hypothetical protein